MHKIFSNIYENKKVLITGHTGFKGSWLYYWLENMGAVVKGYSLTPNTDPSHFSILYPHIKEEDNDIRDLDKFSEVINNFKPDIIFHLAAQPLVRESYDNPVETYQTNVMGTLNILEATRKCESVRAVVVITTDKCYENKEWVWGYRENDPMGGYDPYSSSKGCSELLVSSYRNSFFNLSDYNKKHQTLISSVRAGNVVGGGDWAADRLIPDIVKAASYGESVDIRSPFATRPWQHVLEPLSGYLLIGQKLLDGKTEFAESWNFGPDDGGSVTVSKVLNIAKASWDKISYNVKENNSLHEANLLKLDCSKAHMKLKWSSIWDIEKTINQTIKWYKSYYENSIIDTENDLKEYISDAQKCNFGWTK